MCSTPCSAATRKGISPQNQSSLPAVTLTDGSTLAPCPPLGSCHLLSSPAAGESCSCVRRRAVAHKKGVQTLRTKTPYALGPLTTQLNPSEPGLLGLGPRQGGVPPLRGSWCFPGLRESLSPTPPGDSSCDIQAAWHRETQWVVLKRCSLTSQPWCAVRAGQCRQHRFAATTQIHSIFSRAAGTGLSTCQHCRFGDSPYVPRGKEAVAKQSPGCTCPLRHHPSLWRGDKVSLQWGGPFQLRSQFQRPTTTRVAVGGQCASATLHLPLVLGGDRELWMLPGFWRIPGESPSVWALLTGEWVTVGAAGGMP